MKRLSLPKDVCRRCHCKVTDDRMIRAPRREHRADYVTITLCQQCHDEASALMVTQEKAPHAALRMNGIQHNHPEYEDFVGALNIIAWRCVVDFDPAKGFQLSTYVLNSLKMAVRSIKRKHHRFGFAGGIKRMVCRPASLDELHTDDSSESNLLAMLGRSSELDSLIDLSDQSQRVRNVINTLPRRERFIIQARFLEPSPWSLEDIGQAMNISKERVRQLESQAMEWLKELLASEVAQ